MTDLEQKTLENLNKTGFITELEVASIIKKRNWSYHSNKSYEDLDKNTAVK